MQHYFVKQSSVNLINQIDDNNTTLMEKVFLFLKVNVPEKKEKYKMKAIEELSPELQEMIGFAKPKHPNNDDINGDKARTEYLTEKYKRWYSHNETRKFSGDEIPTEI